jgi:tRNA-dihydrouridine synthase 1
MVKKLHENLKIPVTCKIRCLPTEEQTLQLAKRIEESGCSLLTVHGRCKEHNKTRVGPSNWYIIGQIKKHLDIPVIANGGISTFKDVEEAIKEAGVDGVMSSESILENVALFADKLYDMDDIAQEYLDLTEEFPGEVSHSAVKSHLFKFLYTGL